MFAFCRMAAALVDALCAAVLCFAGFRLGLAIAPCTEVSECVWLAPTIVVLTATGIMIYFGSSHYLWHTTPGRRLFRLD